MALRSSVILPLFTSALLMGCAANDPADTDSGTDRDSDSDGTTAGPVEDYSCDDLMLPCVDESACGPKASDYQPRTNMSADDSWPACVSDGGTYQLVSDPPGSIARVMAFEEMANLLWRNSSTPTADDFTMARTQYLIEQGLWSRATRREDLHYPEIPMSEWSDQVDADKQCTIPELWQKYPDRCVGPALIDPTIDENLQAGQDGNGDPWVNAAKVEAALVWFLYLSVYKEANTCATVAAKDCDSAWAYYTGGNSDGLGIATYIRAASQNTHDRIMDGLLAVRCWRDLNPPDPNMDDMWPLLDAVPQDQFDLFQQGWEQLDNALHRGYAVIVRERLIDHIGRVQNGVDTAPSWAFLQIAGPVLNREATERGAPEAGTLAALWQSDGSDEATLAAGLDALDAAFPCP